jgi:hypothetical protein
MYGMVVSKCLVGDLEHTNPFHVTTISMLAGPHRDRHWRDDQVSACFGMFRQLGADPSGEILPA